MIEIIFILHSISQIVMSGLSIQTVEKMALQLFSFSYYERGMQFPTKLTKFIRLLDDELVSR